jgi:predicted extracellular nuclease
MKLRNFAGVPTLLLAAGLLAGCEPETAPPFTIDEAGAVEGLLFFDADEDAVFDPSDGDYALQGVQVQFRVRGTEQVLAGGTVTSDARGRFEVGNLPAGTHDAYVVPTTLPAGVILCGNPVQVTVEPGVTRFFRLQTRGGCLVLIETAEAQAAGSVVVIRGLVTAAPNQLRAGGDYTYIQDASGGVRVFGSALSGRGIEVGDRVEVSGTIGLFNDDLQVSNPVVRAITPDFGTVTPAATTTGAIAAAGPNPKAPLQGTLVKVTRAQVTGTFGTGGINNRNAIINDGSGATQIRFETGLYSDAEIPSLPTTYAVGKCYDVTGVVGNFRTAGQIFPRTRADVVEVPCS